MPAKKPIIIATRGSALALAQSNLVAAQCRAAFPGLSVELKIIKTTGDKLQSASMAQKGGTLPKGLFTKELEVALLNGKADLAVHSLKDLPTDLPGGLVLAATLKREDVRDVLVYRAEGGFKPLTTLKALPAKTVVATSSTRRNRQLLAAHPDLHVVEIRGNVATRLQKVAGDNGLDATVLALAGLRRLNYQVSDDGTLIGPDVPEGLLAMILDLNVMLPCVGQGAIGIEIRADDECSAEICERLNHPNTLQEVTAERGFLRGMGGGCLSPVAAYAEIAGDQVSLRAVSFQGKTPRRGEAKRPIAEAALLGEQMAAALK